MSNPRTNAPAASGPPDTGDARQGFLAIMSHELRTPLNGILGMAELLGGTPLNDEQRDYVETIRHSGTQLLGLIKNVLDYSQLNAGNVAPRSEHLESLLERASAETITLAFEKGLSVYLDLDPDLPETVEVDGERLHRVVECLLSNACKFTHTGSIVVYATSVSRTASAHHIRIGVSDTGIGIPAELQERIFDLFYQADSSDTRAYGGTGIGLALARRLVSSLGGELKVQSTPGAGARFFFELDLAGTPLDRVALRRQIPERALAAVSDDPLIRDRLAAIAEEWGRPIALHTSPATWGDEPAGTALILDLPSDPAAAAALAPSLRRGDGPVVTLVRPGQEILPELRPLIDSRVDWPIWSHRLLDALAYADRQAASRSRLSPESAPVAPESEVPEAHPLFLLVDAHPINQRIARHMIHRLGGRVHEAPTAADLVHRVTGGRFDAVLINVGIREPDGCEAAAGLRRALGPDTPPLFALGVGPSLRHTSRFAQAEFDGAFEGPLTLDQMRRVIAHIGETVPA
jgi:CheY-like chemotaxis protein